MTTNINPGLEFIAAGLARNKWRVEAVGGRWSVVKRIKDSWTIEIETRRLKELIEL